MNDSKRQFLIGALACLATLTSCGEPEESPPNVILITLDTLRADHLSCYGYEESTSPNMDAFAARATLYDNAVSVAPWTVPTHASLFTGLHPFEHGSHSYEVRGPSRNAYSLADENITLAEILRSESYATAGFVANTIYLESVFALDQGFELWDNQSEPATGINRRAIAWLEERGSEPFFLFLNYLDTHRPYNTQPLPGEEPFPDSEGSERLLDELYKRVMLRGEQPGDLARKLRTQYDRSIRNVDLALGDLFRVLKQLDLYDNTIIVLTSDHGEYFGEHGLVEHSKDVYEEALRIPLIVKAPGQTEPDRVGSLTSSVDIAQIILAELPPAIARKHEPLFPYRIGEHPVVVENYFSRPKDLMHRKLAGRFRRIRTGIYGDGYKFIHSSDGKHELYALEEDPGESTNLVPARSDVAQRLEASLQQVKLHGRPAPGRSKRTEEISAALRAEMKALGYAAEDEDREPDARSRP